MKIQKTPRKKSKKLVLISIPILLLILGGGGYYFVNDRSNTSKTQSSIDYNPPSQEQKDAGSQTKEESTSKQPNDQGDTLPDQSGKRNATVTIVDAAQYDSVVEVRSFVSELTESNGQCTVTFTNAGKTITRKTPTTISANNTQCTTVQVPASEFSPLGEWNVIVTYTSPTTQGTSSQQTITIR